MSRNLENTSINKTVTKFSTAIEQWWTRNAHARSSLEATAIAILALIPTSWLALTTEPGERTYIKVHHSLFLVSIAGVLMVLLTKPPAMASRLVSALRTAVAGQVPDGDEVLAAMLTGLLTAIVVVSTAVIDWEVVGRARGVSAVVAVNTAVIARGLWVKYGPPRGAKRR